MSRLSEQQKVARAARRAKRAAFQAAYTNVCRTELNQQKRRQRGSVEIHPAAMAQLYKPKRPTFGLRRGYWAHRLRSSRGHADYQAAREQQRAAAASTAPGSTLEGSAVSA